MPVTNRGVVTQPNGWYRVLLHSYRIAGSAAGIAGFGPVYTWRGNYYLLGVTAGTPNAVYAIAGKGTAKAAAVSGIGPNSKYR